MVGEIAGVLVEIKAVAPNRTSTKGPLTLENSKTSNWEKIFTKCIFD